MAWIAWTNPRAMDWWEITHWVPHAQKRSTKEKRSCDEVLLVQVLVQLNRMQYNFFLSCNSQLKKVVLNIFRVILTFLKLNFKFGCEKFEFGILSEFDKFTVTCQSCCFSVYLASLSLLVSFFKFQKFLLSIIEKVLKNIKNTIEK